MVISCTSIVFHRKFPPVKMSVAKITKYSYWTKQNIVAVVHYSEIKDILILPLYDSEWKGCSQSYS